jgi:hypothetical protein
VTEYTNKHLRAGYDLLSKNWSNALTVHNIAKEYSQDPRNIWEWKTKEIIQYSTMLNNINQCDSNYSKNV